MRIYSVYLPSAEDNAQRVSEAVFIKEGFSWPALFFPVLWFVFHKMWFVSVMMAGLLALAGWGTAQFDITAQNAFLIHAGLIVLFAFEANNLRGAHLARKGFERSGSVAGHELMEAEEKFFSEQYNAPQHAQPAAETG